MGASLVGQPLHREEGSGTTLLLELFYWNAINYVVLHLLTLCGDTLTMVTWAACTMHVHRAVPGEHGCCSCLHTVVVQQPQNLYIHVP